MLHLQNINGTVLRLFLFLTLCTDFRLSAAVDTMAATDTIKDGDTLVSADGTYELGFFSPGNSLNRYLGIWYKKISNGTVVWVANRETPLNNSAGVLKFIADRGILALFNGSNSIIWSSNSSRTVQNPVAQLLNSGNFVIRDATDTNPDNYLWQSFDYFGNTFLPGMKFGRNMITGFERYMTSWKSNDDPSEGDYVYKFDHTGFPELFLTNGLSVLFRSGPWNGLRFSGTPELKQNSIYTFEFVFNQEEFFYRYKLVNDSVVSRMLLTQNGLVERLTWIDRTAGWNIYLTAQMDNCDTYALCGAYGSCDINNSPMCTCLKGFVPKYPNQYDMADWSNGCVRKSPLACGKGDGFKKYSGVKLPDSRYSWFNTSMSLKECNVECLKNCNCTAYANLDVRQGGSGCLLWFNNLMDIRQLTENGQDLYIRMAASELDKSSGILKNPARTILGILVLMGALLLGVLLALYVCRKRRQKREVISLGKMGSGMGRDGSESHKDDLELPLLDFDDIAEATGYFSISNKLGEGGFGPVYKGSFSDGQEIAVKRLSKDSRQGLDEFKNEVICIAKLQHRNLVKLIGCCIQEDEKLLVYEYMPNKSLNHFIFDKNRSKMLDWPMRFHIINGIARGLLYLHQDSRLRIIHRDLKASNILLDNDMNPKISDFGMARSFGGNETGANTRRVVGTYGYMAPEYAIDGLFSIKSDVFSYGVLVLEIVSGKRNRGFHHPDHDLNLLGHAWKLYKENKLLELIDPATWVSCMIPQVARSILVGLLCVQQSPADRPSMASVVVMLSSESELPEPKPPGFFTERKPVEIEFSSSNKEICSGNDFTLTMLEPR
ncbi:Bulb-type lectin domain [Dillenia turbinata]|uniref:Receptor-like serine/threonine-protein kinase n=1 Tax=Dillenia turbinata TaxID=194707 RepID=A0AAN8VVR4_9MAGN